VDERLRHWISVSGTYGRSKRGMKWDTRHYKAQEYGYGTYRVGGEGTEERKTQWEFGYGTLVWDWREGQGNGNLVLVQSERSRGAGLKKREGGRHGLQIKALGMCFWYIWKGEEGMN
jgi:hypothetical protein